MALLVKNSNKTGIKDIIHRPSWILKVAIPLKEGIVKFTNMYEPNVSKPKEDVSFHEDLHNEVKHEHKIKH